MGGPSSSLTWCLAFDPVAWIAAAVALCWVATSVDDLLALIRGAGHAVLAYLALLAATKAAGFQVEDHSCVDVRASVGFTVASEALGVFPVTVRRDPAGADAFCISEGPVELYVRILTHAG